MSTVKEILLQTLRDIGSHKLRSALTMFGISWGIAAIVFMIAIGDGFKQGYRKMMLSLGKDIVIFWPGRTSDQAGGQRSGRQVYFSYADVLAIRQECYLVAHVTPELDGYLAVRSPFNSGVFSTHGVDPIYQEIRSMEMARGRAITEADAAEGRAVCVIGDEVKTQLFADREAIGQAIHIKDVPFTVIGELRKKEQNNSYKGFDGRKIVLPYSVMARHFPDRHPVIGKEYIDNLIFTPREADNHGLAVAQVKETLGRLHGFKPADEGAIWSWDTAESARMVASVYDSMQMFLTAIAVITLGLGGVGVMNIMLVSVAERTREIGVKQAVGATRTRILGEFFLEALVLTLLSGMAGLAGAFGICTVVNRLPLPTLFSGLPINTATALIAFSTLVFVGIAAAIYPARRASLLTPVEALRYE